MTAQFARFFAQADKNGDQKLTKHVDEVEGGVVPRFPDWVRERRRQRFVCARLLRNPATLRFVP
ncbi:MAG: hypothetical protein P1U81_16240 [Verrucomicrobiales bacterium]|nr:hypothetical protein [Verrucomicrobiales bacterium]